MEFAGLTPWAVPIAALASFAFGAAYYAALARPWAAALGRGAEAGAPSGGARPFVVAVLAQLATAFVLAGLIGHLGVGQVTAMNGVVSGAFCWVGFVLPALATNYGFQGRPVALTLIDGGHWLGVLLIQGAAIGAIGV